MMCTQEMKHKTQPKIIQQNITHNSCSNLFTLQKTYKIILIQYLVVIVFMKYFRWLLLHGLKSIFNWLKRLSILSYNKKGIVAFLTE